MDSKLFGVFVDAEEITIVNPFCKKLQPNTPGEEQRYDEASLFSNISVNVICASPFQFETFSEPIAFTETNYQKHNAQTQPIISTFKDKFYPPPKV